MKLAKDRIINQTKIQFPALSQNESFSRMAVSGFVAQLNPCIDELSDIKTAVSEAVTNAIVHGYREKIGNVELIMKIYKDRILSVTVRDRGCGIENIEKAMEPLFTTGVDEERAGLGFTVMESFMDTVKVHSTVGKGTTVTLVKRLRIKG